MLLTPLAWMAVAAVVTALAALAFVRRRRRTSDDLGLISQQWIAQHRLTSHDLER